MNWKHFVAAGLVAAALGLAGPAAQAAADPEKEPGRELEAERRELERARREVERARAELQRATRDLARSVAKVERDNPKAQYFEYMTNPDRAVIGVLIPDPVETGGEERGVRLLAVTPGGGAEKAGLKAGDLLTSLNGAPLARDGKKAPEKRMKEVMKTLKAGDAVKVEYERDGRRQSATVTTQAPEPDFAMTMPLPQLHHWLHDEDFDKYGPWPPMPMFRGPAIRGLELAKLDEDLGGYFKTTEGVLVIKAPKNGALNLRSGDVIQKIDGQAVAEPITVLDKLRSRGEEQTVKIEIMRQGRKVELEGKVPVAAAKPRFNTHERRVEIAQPGPDDGS